MIFACHDDDDCELLTATANGPSKKRNFNLLENDRGVPHSVRRVIGEFVMSVSGPVKVSPILSGGLRACVPAVATTVVFSFFINLLAVTSPLYMLQIYDRVIGSRREAALLGITVLVGYLLIINALLEMLRARIMVHASMAVDNKLAGAVFDATHSAGLSWPSLAQGQSLRDLDAVREFIPGPCVIALSDLSWMTIFLSAWFILLPWFGVTAIVGAALIFWLPLADDT